jgi:microcystin-dependent protein
LADVRGTANIDQPVPGVVFLDHHRLRRRPGKGVFNLPDLRWRVPTHAGPGSLSTYQLGATGGTDTKTINAAASVKITKPEQLPAHGHPATFTGSGGGQLAQPTVSLKVSKDPATSSTPIEGGYLGAMKLASIGTPPNLYVATAGACLATLNASTTTATGSSGGGITGGAVIVANSDASVAIPVTVPVEVAAVMPPFLAMSHATCIMGDYPPKPW